MQLADLGIIGLKEPISPQGLRTIVDYRSTAPKDATSPTQTSEVPNISVASATGLVAEYSEELAELAVEFNLISPDKSVIRTENAHDLAACQNLLGTMTHLQALMAEEAETVERESWNYDTSVELIKVAQHLHQIPFGGPCRDEYDHLPTMTSKGKEREHPKPCFKRTIYNLRPANAQDVWLGEYPGKFYSLLERFILFFSVPRMPINDQFTKTGDDWLAQDLPEWFGPDADHFCVYRDNCRWALKKLLQDSVTSDITSV